MASRAGGQSESSDPAVTSIVPVLISHSEQPEREILVYALLDNQSDTTFVAPSVMEALGIQGVTTHLSTMTASDMLIRGSKYAGIIVRAQRSETRHALPMVFEHGEIPVKRESIPSPAMAKLWPHLEDISSELMPVQDCRVGILIGYNCPWLLTPREVIPAPDNYPEAPFMVRTALGWSLVVRMGSNAVAIEDATTHRAVNYCFCTCT